MNKTGRKISVSFVSEPAPSNSNDPAYNGNGSTTQGRHNLVLKIVQQKLLRLQVAEVILSLILVVLSAVAIIEERAFFSLGFSMISSAVVILSAVIGIQQGSPRIILLVNLIEMVTLIPAFYFTFVSLHYNMYHQEFEPDKLNGLNGSSPGNSTDSSDPLAYYNTMLSNYNSLSDVVVGEGVRTDSNYYDISRPRASTTIWIVGWLQLLHLTPISFCILYKIYLLRFLYYNYYSNI